MTPAICIDNLQKVYNDGEHNAFTDLCRFGDRLYLAFRTCPDGHMVYNTSRIVVMASQHGEVWERVKAFSVPDRDVRDPHFLVFGDKLFVYSGTWLCNFRTQDQRELNDHLGYCVWTADGVHWQGPRVCEGTRGYYIWRAASCGDKAFLNGRCKRGFQTPQTHEEQWAICQSALLESRDGTRWKPAALFQDGYGDETAFVFEQDGTVVAVMRNGRRSEPAVLCRAEPPYEDWQRTELGNCIGGPLLARWGRRYLVGGRKLLDSDRPLTALYWLERDRLREALELPSGGDCSYPGFVMLDDDTGLLSYYSSHEGGGPEDLRASIYLAHLRIRA